MQTLITLASSNKRQPNPPRPYFSIIVRFALCEHKTNNMRSRSAMLPQTEAQAKSDTA
jgi:hypothetical protein